MLPLWLRYQLERSDQYFRTNLQSPLSSLLLLLQEIGQFQGPDLLLAEPPRSAALHPGKGMYLFYSNGSRESRFDLTSVDASYPEANRQLASFELADTTIQSVRLRYHEPLDTKSAVDPRTLTGWMGTARLIESAVKSSPYFGKLQTIEMLDTPMSWYKDPFFDRDSIIYEIWVEQRSDWGIGWSFDGGQWKADGRPLTQECFSGNDLIYSFYPGSAMLLARVKVDRHELSEVVTDIQLYPEFRCPYYDPSEAEEESGSLWYDSKLTTMRQPDTGSPLSYQRASGKKLPPHSDLEMVYVY